MKQIVICLVAVALLAGCTSRGDGYVDIPPTDGDCIDDLENEMSRLRSRMLNYE